MTSPRSKLSFTICKGNLRKSKCLPNLIQRSNSLQDISRAASGAQISD